MSEISPPAALLTGAEPAWSEYLGHSFFEAIGDGSIGEGQMLFWLLQDIPYLDAYVAARHAIRAAVDDDASLRHIAERIQKCDWAGQADQNEEIGFELELLALLGFTAKPDRDRFAAGPARAGYIDHITRCTMEGRLSQTVAAIAPCELGFSQMGLRLAERRASGLPALSKRWIEYYASDEQTRRAVVTIDLLSILWDRADGAERTRMVRIFQRSVSHQLAALDAAWRERDPWPEEDRARALTR
jgi:thiaminase (transcriptional activator TenA)